MSIFVKICGLCSAEDVASVATMRPDALGFVFWRGSKRNVLPSDVAEWAKKLPSSILKVGVFVDSAPPAIRQVVEEAGLDVVQLHGFQSLEKASGIFPMSGKKRGQVWSVVHLGRGEPEGGASVDAYLLDSYSQESPGGTGKTCDWNAARAFVLQSPKKVLLAGGLTPENVREAIERVRPWGVDVSSGVEERPGRKDLAKVGKFIERCRS